MPVISVVQRLQRALRFACGEEGQAMVEYALLVSLLTLAAFVGVQAFGHGVADLYSNIVARYPHG